MKKYLVKTKYLFVVAISLTMLFAFADEENNHAEGRRLFTEKGGCQSCHGWSGDGQKMDNQMPDGANLREMQLDRQTFITIVKCGVPGTGMPAFDKFAYADGRCYGKKLVDLRSQGTKLVDPPATLQNREIDMLADFAVDEILGKGPINKSSCISYWGKLIEICASMQ